jgi:hypothetical protein
MIAFHGKQEIKDKYLDRIRKHRAADELISGATGEGGKGCAVWCTLNKYSHAAYETELGIPQSIARLEDGIFEALPEAVAMEWPERFLASIEPGADLSLVMSHWFVWMLTDSQDGVLQYAKTERSRETIQKVSDLYARRAAGENVGDKELRSAAAYAAAYAADADAAADAAYTAAAYAADAAADAADAAYTAAAYADAAAADAADAAYAAAADAVYAADAAAAAYAAAAYAAAAARFNTREKQANKLVELLAAAPQALAVA